MFKTNQLSSAVVTILTKSPTCSMRAQNFFQSFFRLRPVNLHLHEPQGNDNDTRQETNGTGNGTDRLNQTLTYRPFLEHKFHSAASVDGNGTVFHFLSVHGANADTDTDIGASDDDDEMIEDGVVPLSILSIIDSNCTNDQDDSSNVCDNDNDNDNDNDSLIQEAVQKSRDIIAHHITSSTVDVDGAQNGNDTGDDDANVGKSMSLARIVQIAALRTFRKDITTSHLLPLQNGLPIIHIEDRDGRSTRSSRHSVSNEKSIHDASLTSTIRLREIVLPFASDSKYPDGSSLLQKLSKLSSLQRPITGLYQLQSSCSSSSFHDGIILRPLPVGTADITTPPPTLVYQLDSLEDIHSNIHNIPMDVLQRMTHKVGCNSNVPGQLILHPQLMNTNNSNGNDNGNGTENSRRDPSGVIFHGLELRYCEAKHLSSSFAEAQDSLMAGSLEELQNANVMVQGGNTTQSNSGDNVVVTHTSAASESSSSTTRTHTHHDNHGSVRRLDDHASKSNIPSRVDTMNGLGDCWVEFRANMKQPLGFMKNGWKSQLNPKGRSKNGNAIQRVAKAPNLPYQ